MSRRAGPALGVLLLVAVAAPAPGRSGPVAPAAPDVPVALADAAAERSGWPAAAEPSGEPAAAGGRPLAGASRIGRFDWPLAGPPRPVRRFDPPPRPWLSGHRGVDLAAAPGVEVRAAGAGIVLFAGPVAGRPVITVGHADGLRTTYEPVRPQLPVGSRVVTGAPIGTLLAGHPGCPAVACLHWGLRRGEDYLDPLALLGLGPIRLLPLDLPAAPAQLPASRAGRRAARRSYSSGVL